jgi:hypothetical protein
LNPGASGVRFRRFAKTRGGVMGASLRLALPTSMNRAFKQDHYEILLETKREICLSLYRIQYRKSWTALEMALHLGTTRSRISNVLYPRPECTTFDQLFTYLVIAEPRFKILISI